MRLVLIRHAVTAETGKKLSGRLPGIPLSPEGIDAAWSVAASLANMDIAAVYTSPIQRCRETAAIIAAPLQVKPRTVQGLVEVEYGAWSGRSLKSLYRLRLWKGLMADPTGFRFPQGETLEEVRARAVRTVRRLERTHSEEDTVVAVSHGDVIRSIAAHALTQSVDVIHRLHVAPLGITVVETSDKSGPRVTILNAPRL
ncbi:MAG: phosphoglycerate mutase [Acidimicrobiia bacterium]|nr:phosphoglycerate mutase [Acidimicrobiia bacterium]